MTSYPSATSVLSVFVRAFRTPDLRKKLLFSGVGNGMSVLMFTSIMAVIPGEIGEIYAVKRFFYAAAAVLVIIAVTTLIVFIEQGQRRLPVQYAKRITGRRVYGGGQPSSCRSSA